MEEYQRKYASFSLCGLNCCLCPRFHTDGSSKCPGCGGIEFSMKHPTCAVVSCNKKHDEVEFCYECSSYPCKRYQVQSKVDSFITYQNVLQDQAAAKIDIDNYLRDLQKKEDILVDLIANYNDGKSKGFYCLAVNLLPLSALDKIIGQIKAGGIMDMQIKEKAKEAAKMINAAADSLNIELVLRR